MLSTESEGTAEPLLNRDRFTRKPQSAISRFFCKLTNQPDDMATQQELTEASRQGNTALEARLDTAFYNHFKDKMNRGMETELDYKPNPTSPTCMSVARALNILDETVEDGILRNTLRGLDKMISLQEIARSGIHGHTVRGYHQDDNFKYPLNWKKVRVLRDQTVEAIDSWVSACDEVEAERRLQSYGVI